ncbi:MAG: PQQ-dependent sugar dehydrogenase [Nannocystaceae bacterium]|nr:PQQ-dependent sugar dehydrogenase [Nannocystaceae bacterium]
MYPRVRFACLSSSLLLGLSLTACGDDGSADGATDSGSSSTATPTTGTPTTTTPGTTQTPTTSTTTSTATATDDATDTSPTATDDATDTSPTDSTTGEPVECPYDAIEGEQSVGFELVATGFNQPLFVLGDPVDTDVLYVLQKSGAIKRLGPDDDTAPAADWFSLTVNTASEMGLLGMAFHPEYADNGLMYLLHSDSVSSWRVTEFSVEGGEVNAGSARQVLGMAQPAPNHNGGMIQFGPDGMLYVSSGDGGVQNDGCGNGQNTDTHHGSILRIDVASDGSPDTATSCGTCTCPGVDGFDYTVPGDNPFVDNDSIDDAIYAYGFRNPWRFSFDPEGGTLFVADVGQEQWEEVTVVEAGTNHGWGDMEGNHCFNAGGCDESAAPGETNNDGLVAPIAEYNHGNGRCSITGLGVYRSCEVPGFDGLYFYSDLCSGEVYAVSYDGATSEVIGPVGNVPSNMSPYGGGYNAYGDVFIAGVPAAGGAGSIYRITAG